jgi:hypothetical protein
MDISEKLDFAVPIIISASAISPEFFPGEVDGRSLEG